MEKLFKSLVFVAFLVTVLSCRGNGTRVENSDPQVESVVLNFQAQANGTLKAFVENVEKQTGNKIAKGSLVKFVATANKDYEVNEWTGGVQVDATDRTKASIKADSDVNVTVSFRKKQSEPKEEVVLNFQAQANGTLKAFVENVEKQTGNKIAKGSLVKFVATANKDYEVNEWTGGVQVDATDRTKASIKADSDVNVTVSFKEKQSEPKEEVVLNFQAQANGTLKAFVENVEKQTGNKIAKGSLVKFVATANKDYEVNEWTGGVQVDATDRTKASIKADSDVNVTVSFKEKQSEPKEEVVLNFQAQANGTVKAFVENVEKQTGNKIPKGSLVKFVATANKDYEVNEWTGGVQVDATDRTKASIKADSDVNVTVSFREKQSELKEVEITKVIISNKEWDASTKTITMPKDYTSFAKDNVKVWGRAKDSKDVFEELEVDSISQDPVEPTQEGVEVTITTKTNAKFKAGSVKVIVKKLGAKENIILTKIIIKEKEADMLSNLVFFDHPVPKITKDDVKVEGKAFGDVISTPLEIESIDPVEVTVSPLGSIFTIKTKETEKYNATSHNITVVKKYSGVELECIKLRYAWDSYYKSKVEDGISVITVNSRDKDKEFTVDDIKVEFGGLDQGQFNVDSIIPDKIKPSNEGFGAKCIVIVRGTYGSISVLEIPFYIRHR